MNPVKVRSEAKVGPVIHDQADGNGSPGRPRPQSAGGRIGRPRASVAPIIEMLLQGSRMLHHHPRVAGFVAVLEEGATGGGEFVRGRQQPSSVWEATLVENRVKARNCDPGAHRILFLLSCGIKRIASFR